MNLRPAITEAVGRELQELGRILRCTTCGRECPLGDVSEKLRAGWPSCHGTMQWVTSRQLGQEKADRLRAREEAS